MHISLSVDRPEEPDLGERRELTWFFKALTDDTRRNILRLLAVREHSVNEIVGNFELSQPTISRHLAVLKRADLVIDHRRGQRVIYQLNAETLWGLARGFFGTFRRGQGADPSHS